MDTVNLGSLPAPQVNFLTGTAARLSPTRLLGLSLANRSVCGAVAPEVWLISGVQSKC